MSSRNLRKRKTRQIVLCESSEDEIDEIEEKNDIKVGEVKGKSGEISGEKDSEASTTDSDGNNGKKGTLSPKEEEDGSSSDSSVENYLKPANEIDLDSSFFTFEKIEDAGVKKEPSRIGRLSSSEDSEIENEEKPQDIKVDEVKVEEKVFETLEIYQKKLEEAKKAVEKYKNRKAKEEKPDIKKLLSVGEAQVGEKMESSYISGSSDDEMDWDDIDAQNELSQVTKEIPKEGVSITIGPQQVAAKKKKQDDYLMQVRRRLNRIRKENQVSMHKVHLLCWIAHGNYANSILNSQNLLGLCLSLIPNENCYPPARADLKYLEQITRWYSKNVRVVEKVTEKIPTISLEKILSVQISKKEANSKKNYVLIFICILRALGVQCRLILSLRPLPLRPPQSELCSLSTKDKNQPEKNGGKSDKNEATTSKLGDKQPKNSKTNLKSQKVASVNPKTIEKEAKPISKETKSTKKALKDLKTSKESLENTKSSAESSSNASKGKRNPKQHLENPTNPTESNINASKDIKKDPKVTLEASKTSKPTEEKVPGKKSTRTHLQDTTTNPTKAEQLPKEEKSSKSRENFSEKPGTQKGQLSKEEKAPNDPKDSNEKPDTKTQTSKDEKASSKTSKVPEEKLEELKNPQKSSRSRRIIKPVDYQEVGESSPEKMRKDEINQIIKDEKEVQKKASTSRRSLKLVKTGAQGEQNEAKSGENDRGDVKTTEKDKNSLQTSEKGPKTIKKSPNRLQTLEKGIKAAAKSSNGLQTSDKAIKATDKSPKPAPRSRTTKKDVDETTEVTRVSRERRPTKKDSLEVPKESARPMSFSSKKESSSLKVEELKPRSKSSSTLVGISRQASSAKPKRIGKSTLHLSGYSSEDDFKPDRRSLNSSLTSLSPKNNFKNDIMNILKGDMLRQKETQRSRLVRKKPNYSEDSDSDYMPEPDKKLRKNDSEDEFKETQSKKKSLTKVKQRVKPKTVIEKEEKLKLEKSKSGVDRRVLSSDDNGGPPKKEKVGNDVWCEVFLEAEEKWISVDVHKAQVHCVSELSSRASTPVTYVLAWNSNLSIKDVTSRYCPQMNTVTRKLRVDADWWKKTLKPYLGRKTARDKEEDDDLARQQLEQPFPKTIMEYKNHPLYALKRHLLKFEALYPPDAVTLGFVRNEPIYARECVHTLHSRDIWIKHAKVVRLGEQPYKIVKARPKYDKLSGQMITDKPLEIFGPWQVEDYIPPNAENGVVPRNAYGNVELFKPCMLPGGTVHLQLPGLNKICRRLQIDCAPALVGFEFHSGGTHPTYDGFIVCKEYKDQLIQAWEEEQEEIERREREKIEKRVYDNWKKLIRGLLIREKLKHKYGFETASGSGKGKKKPKGPRFVAKKRRVISGSESSS